jgi:hypothetical protein
MTNDNLSNKQVMPASKKGGGKKAAKKAHTAKKSSKKPAKKKYTDADVVKAATRYLKGQQTKKKISYRDLESKTGIPKSIISRCVGKRKAKAEYTSKRGPKMKLNMDACSQELASRSQRSKTREGRASAGTHSYQSGANSFPFQHTASNHTRHG